MNIFRLIGLSIALLILATAPADAGLLEWTMEREADPFSGGEKVSVDFMSSFRSGVVLLCDTAEHGLVVRAIP